MICLPWQFLQLLSFVIVVLCVPITPLLFGILCYYMCDRRGMNSSAGQLRADQQEETLGTMVYSFGCLHCICIHIDGMEEGKGRTYEPTLLSPRPPYIPYDFRDDDDLKTELRENQSSTPTSDQR
jgi:hypothetical protein